MSTAETQIAVNTNLQKQDLSNLDISNLTPLSPEVISRQATINIGTIGHVAHGKSTVVKAISGVQTVRFKNELERNITIKLERISAKTLQTIMKSKRQRREYEARESKRLQKLAEERRSRKCITKQTTTVLNTSKKETRLSNKLQPAETKTITQSYNITPLRRRSSRRSSHSSSSICTTLSSNQPTSPISSSGYGSSVADNDDQRTISAANFMTTVQKMKIIQQPQSQPHPSKRSRDNDEPNTVTPTVEPPSKRPKVTKPTKGEYVVENIVSVEAINSNPVFFVKWLNYSSKENTWESFENVGECAQLDAFVEEQYTFFEPTIAKIVTAYEEEIERENLTYDLTKLNVAELELYEPLKLKVDLILLAQFRCAGSRSQVATEQIRQRILQSMLIKPYYYQRKQQLLDLASFEKRMNKIESAAPIKVENLVDLDVIDSSFCYTSENIYGPDVPHVHDAPIGCKCVNGICTPTSGCCARMADSYFAYDKTGRLRIRPGEAIYECNNRCNCDVSCNNRMIQRGRKNALCLFKTSNGRGWGVRAESVIRKGEFVCEYVGEVITTDEANERGKIYDDNGRTYLFDLDYNTAAESIFTIDAAIYGNISHFINHSCDPNLAVFPFWINNLDVNMPRLAFFALRQIKSGEELNFDYICAEFNPNVPYKNLSQGARVECRCGAEKCRKVLF